MTSSGPLPTKKSRRFERLIEIVGILCALLIVAATIAHSIQLREEIRGEVEGHVKTVARILTQEVNRSLTRTSVILEQIDEMASTQKVINSPDSISKLEAFT